MASALPAILASILGQTAAGLPKGMQEADVLAQHDATRAESARQFDTQQARLDANFREQQDRLTKAQTTDLSPFGGPASVPTALAGPLMTVMEGRRKEAAEQGERMKVADFIRQSKGTPGQLMGTLGMEEDPEAGAFLPRTTGTPHMDDRDLLAGLASFKGVSPELFKQLAPPPPKEPKAPEPYTLRPDEQRYGPDNTLVASGPVRPTRPETQSAAYVEAVDALEQLEGAPVRDAAAIARAQQRVNRLKPMVLPEGGVVAGPGGGGSLAVGPPKTQPLPAGEAGNLADAKTLLGQLQTAEQMYNPAFVGPVRGRMGALGQMTGIGVSNDEVDLRTLVASFRNQLLRLRSGAAVTPQEYERIKNELPDVNDPPQVFARKLAVAKDLLGAAIQNREAQFNQRGFRGGQAPEAAPAAAPRSVRVRDPKTGRTGTVSLAPGEPLPAGLQAIE